MSEELNKNESQKYVENLVKLGKMVSMEAAKNKELEDRIKKMSSY